MLSNNPVNKLVRVIGDATALAAKGNQSVVQLISFGGIHAVLCSFHVDLGHVMLCRE